MLGNKSNIFNEKMSREELMVEHEWLLYGRSRHGEPGRGRRAGREGEVVGDRHAGSRGDKLPEDEKLLCIKNAAEISSGVYGKPVAALSAINKRVWKELLR